MADSNDKGNKDEGNIPGRPKALSYDDQVGPTTTLRHTYKSDVQPEKVYSKNPSTERSRKQMGLLHGVYKEVAKAKQADSTVSIFVPC